jgi:2-oxoglutarate ferredoxin oxidoreductase subunit delta
MKYWRTPLDLDRVKVPHGTVHILAERCKGCGFCIEYCPKDILVFSKAFNRKGYHYPEVVKDGECVNCNLCEMICPDFAIFSQPVPDEEELAAADGAGAAKGDVA